MNENMVVIVTGASRGIGRALCELILESQQNMHLYACSTAGSDLSLAASSPSTKISYTKLDISKNTEIQSLLRLVKQNDGHVDVLVNNAGTNTMPEHTPQSVQKTLDINYRGTLAMCQSFIPLLSKQGRIVNLSSVASGLQIYHRSIQERFRNPLMTLQDAEQLAQEYQSAVNSGSEAKHGWPEGPQAYSVSKALVNAITATLARQNPGLVINCCCPGWVNTDMGEIMGKPPKEPADGARIPVKLGFGNIGNATGAYWSNPSISDRGDGRITAW